jgi:hypothetical protein
MRKKSVMVGSITILVIVGVSIALSASSPATLRGASPVHGVSTPQAPILIFNRKLVSTTQSYSNGVGAVGAGFQAMDSLLNFTCPAATCTISAEQNAQVDGLTTGNEWAICTQVDGNYMAQPNCPFLGYVSSDGSFVTGGFVQNMNGVAKGNHTIQTFIYTVNGANLGIYNITYRLYTP